MINKYKVVCCMLVSVLAFFGTYGPATAQDSSSGSTLSSNDWEFTIIPYFWMAGINGDITVRGQTADVDVSFGDVWDALDFGAQVHIEVKKGNWGFFIDPTYLKLSIDQDVQVFDVGPGADVDLELKQFLLEFGGFYRLGTWPGGTNKPSIALDALAGGRYVNLDVEIDIDSALPIPSEVDGDQDWLDLFVGGRMMLNPTEKLSFVCVCAFVCLRVCVFACACMCVCVYLHVCVYLVH